jgi:hypothetical protein
MAEGHVERGTGGRHRRAKIACREHQKQTHRSSLYATGYATLAPRNSDLRAGIGAETRRDRELFHSDTLFSQGNQSPERNHPRPLRMDTPTEKRIMRCCGSRRGAGAQEWRYD